jgi:trans-aconitate methyltransferase
MRITEGTCPGWMGDQYAAESGHHRTFDDWFLDYHPPQPHDRIVDAGCGSGEFTARLASIAAKGRVIGVEPDLSMLQAAARHEARNLDFRQGRVQDLDLVCDASWADLVVSRAMFHWLPLDDYQPSYEAIWRVLRPGGWFHAESGGAGNVAELARVLDEVAARLELEPAQVSFPHPGLVHERLEQAGFEVPPSGVTTVAQRRSFDRHQIVGLIRTQASMAYGLGADDDRLARFLAEATDHLDELQRQDRSYDQIFVRLHVRCCRPG